MHVTLRARLAVLRSEHVFPTVRLALSRTASRNVDQFRLLQYSVQSDHVHLVVEASDKRSLARGMQGLAIRVALYVNELLSRRGTFWSDRWHGRALRTPREVRNALAYVLANFRKHTNVQRSGIDPFSSAEWFDGWRTTTGVAPPFAVPRRFSVERGAPIVSAARSWLARGGWRRHGLIGSDEAPGLEQRSITDSRRRGHSARPRPVHGGSVFSSKTLRKSCPNVG